MKNIPKTYQNRKYLRLGDFDYSQNGAYYITIVTQGRACLFGTVENEQMVLNDAGRMVVQVRNELPEIIDGVKIEPYQVMPNHFHAIILIESPKTISGIKGKNQCQTSPKRRNFVDLSDIVGRFKSLTTKRYIDGVSELGWTAFADHLWQRGYYEHIIRNDRDHQAVVDYIAANPMNWLKDDENR